ncbi:hypothetical protein XA68_16585 [Ophiocordyceps unilateralis]|uniref:INO80 complex subunit F domain-containing protein n=1 Tax=Ophiocordyceps unilateralis TaxID=268505 RepID=A0A2A9P5C2_OPHUN|nr:hypothetical protein XA68_16585 [Ophiocordyceps unilateralis]
MLSSEATFFTLRSSLCTPDLGKFKVSKDERHKADDSLGSGQDPHRSYHVTRDGITITGDARSAASISLSAVFLASAMLVYLGRSMRQVPHRIQRLEEYTVPTGNHHIFGEARRLRHRSLAAPLEGAGFLFPPLPSFITFNYTLPPRDSAVQQFPPRPSRRASSTASPRLVIASKQLLLAGGAKPWLFGTSFTLARFPRLTCRRNGAPVLRTTSATANRTNEVEDANDAARLRLARIKRQVEKLRIERAFLLEQLAKRTSTNVEDSEGSPSPPPTPADIRSGPDTNPAKAKDKPLRIKRGHRKSAAAGDAESKAGPSKGGASPTSESQSQSKVGKSGSANGATKGPATEHRTAYHLYEEAARPEMEARAKALNIDIEEEYWWMEEELSRGWDELSPAKKEEWCIKYMEELEDKAELEDKKKEVKGTKDGKQKEHKPSGETSKQKERKPSGGSGKDEAQDDDIEMVHYDTEDQEQANKGGDE